MNFEDELPALLSLSEISTMTHVSPTVLLNEVRAGRLAAHKIGSRWMCTYKQAEAWLMRTQKQAHES